MTEAKWNPGAFVWRELMTPDVEKAKAFYGELFGWSYEDAPMGDFVYTLIKAGEKAVGGMMPMQGSEHPPHWMSYASVPDVDASASAARAHGGQVPVGPMDVPNVGRFAVIGDPDGAYVTVFRSAMGDPPAGAQPGLGEFCWETLSTKDIERAKSFYAAVVGWKGGTGPMGPDVTLFSMGEQIIADVQLAESMPPSWATYVVVSKIEDAQAKLTKLGGKTIVPRIDIPTVGGVGFFADPSGAVLGLYEPAAS